MNLKIILIKRTQRIMAYKLLWQKNFFKKSGKKVKQNNVKIWACSVAITDALAHNNILIENLGVKDMTVSLKV